MRAMLTEGLAVSLQTTRWDIKKKGGRRVWSGCSEQPRRTKEWNAASLKRRRFCSVSRCGRFAVRWRKIFAGDTKTGVNRVQDSAAVIRGGGNKWELMFFSWLFCDVKCFTHAQSAVKRNRELKRDKDRDLETDIYRSTGKKTSKKCQTSTAKTEKILSP